MGRLLNSALLLFVAFVVITNRTSAQHETEIFVGSTENATGALAVRYDFSVPIPLFQNVCAAGRCLFVSTNPGVQALAEGDTDSGLFPLVAGTTLYLEIITIDSRLSVKIGDRVLRSPGQSVVLGTSPDLHVHPSWQANVAQGEVGTWSVEIRITSSSRYQASPRYTLLFTNAPVEPTSSPTATHSPGSVVSPSATPVSTSTPTVPPEQRCPGDCDADRKVTVHELVRGVAIALGVQSLDSCVALDTDGDSRVTVDELVIAVRRALNGCANDSGGRGSELRRGKQPRGRREVPHPYLPQ